MAQAGEKSKTDLHNTDLEAKLEANPRYQRVLSKSALIPAAHSKAKKGKKRTDLSKSVPDKMPEKAENDNKNRLDPRIDPKTDLSKSVSGIMQGEAKHEMIINTKRMGLTLVSTPSLIMVICSQMINSTHKLILSRK